MAMTDTPKMQDWPARRPGGPPVPTILTDGPVVTEDPGWLSMQEQAVLAAVIAPIARRMALVSARKAQEAVCDEILRRLETEIGETWGMSKVTGVANMVKAVRANPPAIGM